MSSGTVRLLTAVTCGLLFITHYAAAQSTTFSYQGQLFVGTRPANGNYDFQFKLFDALTMGNQIGSAYTNSSLAVTNALFNAQPDFGTNFSGPSRWLEISVRTNGSTADYVILNPRQAITPTPRALFADNAGVSSASNLTGILPSGVFPATLPAASGANLTSIPESGVTGLVTDLASRQPLSANLSTLAAGSAAPILGTSSTTAASGNDPRILAATATNDARAVNLANPANVFAGAHSGNAGAGGLTNLVFHVYNVRDFGAGNGSVAADSLAFRTVMGIITNSGGTMYLPPGNYYDTNTYGIYSLASGVVSTAPYSFIGEGSEQTVWHFLGTNAVQFTFSLSAQPQLVKGITFMAGTQLKATAAQGNGGTNTCFYQLYAAGHHLMQDVSFVNWQGVGFNARGGGASGKFEKIQAWYCGTGVILSGYCDDTLLQVIGYNCTNAVVETSVASSVAGNKALNGYKIDIFGANNNRGIIIGNGGSCTISGYIENTTNSVVTIGHPDLTDFGIGAVLIEGLGMLSYSIPQGPEAMCQIYTAPSLLVVRNVEGCSTINVLSMNAASDLAPIIFETPILNGTPIVMFSDGTSIANRAPLNMINVTENRWQKGAGAPVNYFTGGQSTNFVFSTQNASMDSAGRLIPRIAGGMRTVTSPAPGTTYNVDLATAYQDVNVNGSVTVALTNLAFYNPTNSAHPKAIFLPGNAAATIDFSGISNLHWLSESGTGVAPTNIPAHTALVVDFIPEVSPTQTNIWARAMRASY